MHVFNPTLSSVLLLLTTFFFPAFASPAQIVSRAPATNLPVEIIHQFPIGTWVENLAVRSNGQILATILSAPQLYQVDPDGKGDPILIHTFPNAPGISGIAELGQDVFYIATSSLNVTTFTFSPGSSSVYKVDMQAAPAQVSKVADFPLALFLNGITVLDQRNILIAEAIGGVVYRLNVVTGKAIIVIDDLLMKTTLVPFTPGVNGLNIRNGNLFFTNSNLNIAARQAINPDGTAKQKARIVVRTPTPDDFALGPKAEYFIAQSPYLAFSPPTTDDVVVTALNVSRPELDGATAVRFGRRDVDRTSVYVSTNGGTSQYLKRKFTQGGRVSRVNVESLLISNAAGIKRV